MLEPWLPGFYVEYDEREESRGKMDDRLGRHGDGKMVECETELECPKPLRWRCSVSASLVSRQNSSRVSSAMSLKPCADQAMDSLFGIARNDVRNVYVVIDESCFPIG
jgi:hypothetical protein